jgi:hypothetical protein
LVIKIENCIAIKKSSKKGKSKIKPVSSNFLADLLKIIYTNKNLKPINAITIMGLKVVKRSSIESIQKKTCET